MYSIGIIQNGNSVRYAYINKDSGLLIKDVCGEYPSAWDNEKTANIIPKLKKATLLLESPERYDYFTVDGWGGIDSVRASLIELIGLCEEYPDCKLGVDW